MIFFLGKEFSDKRLLKYGLCDVFGIGFSYSLYLCKKAGISLKGRFSLLKREHIRRINACVSLERFVSTDLHKLVGFHVKNHLKKKTYKGMRFLLRLPVNGQRTKTNRKTARKGLQVKYF